MWKQFFIAETNIHELDHKTQWICKSKVLSCIVQVSYSFLFAAEQNEVSSFPNALAN